MSGLIKTNTEELRDILQKVSELPEAGGIELPELTNEGSASDLMLNKELIDGNGNVITGTFTIDDELTTQDNLIAQIQTVVDNLPEAGGSCDSEMVKVNVDLASMNPVFYLDSSGIVKLGKAGTEIQAWHGIVMYQGAYSLVSTGIYTASKNGFMQVVKFKADGGSVSIAMSGGADN